MSNIDFGFRMLSDALSNLQQSQYRKALGTGLSPMGQDQSQQQPQGAQYNIGSPASMMAKAQPFMQWFDAASTKYGVPKNILLATAAQESQFNPNAKGPTGDVGLMQFTAPTAQKYGVNPLDPASSIDGAARLLRDNYRRFGSWQAAINAYNTGGSHWNAAYVGSVGQYASVFDNLMGGNPPKEPGTPPTITLQPGKDYNVTSTPGAAGPQAAGQADTLSGSGSSDTLQGGSSSDTLDNPDQPTPEQIPQLVQQLNGLRVKRGLPPFQPGEAENFIRQAGMQQVQQLLGGASPPQIASPPVPPALASAARAPTSTQTPDEQTAIAQAQDEARQGVPTQAGQQPDPAGRATAAQRSQAQFPGRDPRFAEGPQGRPVPGAPPRAGTQGPQGRPINAQPGHPATDPQHPAHAPAEVAKAIKADPSDPPAGPPLNANGYFDYNSVWGKGFTLPQLIYNIKKANPNISPGVLAGAVLLAQPMLTSAATENYHNTMEQMRQYGIEQGVAKEQSREQTQRDIAAGHDEVKLIIQKSVDALKTATLGQRMKEFAYRQFTTNQELELKTKRLFDQEQNAANQLDMERQKLAFGKAKAADAKVIAAERQANNELHQAIQDKIHTASAQFMDEETRAQLEKEENDRFQKAQKKVQDLERFGGGNGQTVIDAGDL